VASSLLLIGIDLGILQLCGWESGSCLAGGADAVGAAVFVALCLLPVLGLFLLLSTGTRTRAADVAWRVPLEAIRSSAPDPMIAFAPGMTVPFAEPDANGPS
jgi:hypothetical protein